MLNNNQAVLLTVLERQIRIYCKCSEQNGGHVEQTVLSLVCYSWYKLEHLSTDFFQFRANSIIIIKKPDETIDICAV